MFFNMLFCSNLAKFNNKYIRMLVSFAHGKTLSIELLGYATRRSS